MLLLHRGHLFYSRQAIVFRGVFPPERAKVFPELVYEHTLGFTLASQTLEAMKQDDDALPELFEKLENTMTRFMKLFNGDWQAERPQHYCCADVNGERRACHTTLQAARRDMADAATELTVTVFWSNMSENTTNMVRGDDNIFTIELLEIVPRFDGQSSPHMVAQKIQKARRCSSRWSYWRRTLSGRKTRTGPSRSGTRTH